MTDTVAYLPGEAWLISGAAAMVMTEGDAAGARRYWNLLRRSASARELIDGIGSGPAAGALAVLVWEPAGVRVLVRGTAVVRVHPADGARFEVTAAKLLTWREELLADVAEVEVVLAAPDLPAGGPDDGDLLPVPAGVVRAAFAYRRTEDQPSPTEFVAPESESGRGAEVEPEPETGREVEPDPDTGSEAAPEAGPAPGPGLEAASQPEPEPGTGPEAAHEPDARSGAAAVPPTGVVDDADSIEENVVGDDAVTVISMVPASDRAVPATRITPAPVPFAGDADGPEPVPAPSSRTTSATVDPTSATAGPTSATAGPTGPAPASPDSALVDEAARHRAPDVTQSVPLDYEDDPILDRAPSRGSGPVQSPDGPGPAAPAPDLLPGPPRPGLPAPVLGDHDGITELAEDLPAGFTPPPLPPPLAAGWVYASVCPSGHANQPHAGNCRICGQPIPPGDPVAAPQPLLGRLRLSTGELVDLDRRVIIGRAPSVSRVSSSELPRLVTVPSPQQDISRSHVEVRIEDWHVVVADLHSTNGTVLRAPDRPEQLLHPGQEMVDRTGLDRRPRRRGHRRGRGGGLTRRPPSPPPELDGYTVTRLLGSGGFADVYLYEQRLPRRPVAVKVLVPGAADGELLAQFDAEANLMAALSTHPAIVTIHQAGIAADGRPYLVMEYCSRPNLSVRYRAERMSVAEVLRIGVRLSGAVETAHRAGILHRDIKPANVLTTDFGHPALTDFGISVHSAPPSFGASAMAEVAPPSAAGTVGMSIPWTAPEVFAEGTGGDERADIYALAATLYTVLARRSPFDRPGGPNGSADLINRIRSSPVPPIGRPDVPASLERVLARAMDKNPAARYRTALDLARALQQVETELRLAPTPVDVLDEDPDAAELLGSDPVGGPGTPATRIRSLTVVDPATRADSARTAAGRPAGPEDTTRRIAPRRRRPGLRAAADVAARTTAGEPGHDLPGRCWPPSCRPPRHPVRWLPILIGGGVLVAAAALVLAGHRHQRHRSAQRTRNPRYHHPVGGGSTRSALSFRSPTHLSGAAQGARVVFTWDEPATAARRCVRLVPHGAGCADPAASHDRRQGVGHRNRDGCASPCCWCATTAPRRRSRRPLVQGGSDREERATTGPGGAEMTMHVEFCGEWTALDPETVFTIGRDGDLQIDDNPYLHRYFLQVAFADGLWWLANTGSQLVRHGQRRRWRGAGVPGPRRPAAAGLRRDDGAVHRRPHHLRAHPGGRRADVHPDRGRDRTRPGRPPSGRSCSPDRSGRSSSPWPNRCCAGRAPGPAPSRPRSRRPRGSAGRSTRFNRKLDNVCEKLDRRGVRGLRGGAGQLAVNRRARLVEHAVASRLVTPADLALLEQHW